MTVSRSSSLTATPNPALRQRTGISVTRAGPSRWDRAHVRSRGTDKPGTRNLGDRQRGTRRLRLPSELPPGLYPSNLSTLRASLHRSAVTESGPFDTCAQPPSTTRATRPADSPSPGNSRPCALPARFQAGCGPSRSRNACALQQQSHLPLFVGRPAHSVCSTGFTRVTGASCRSLFGMRVADAFLKPHRVCSDITFCRFFVCAIFSRITRLRLTPIQVCAKSLPS